MILFGGGPGWQALEKEIVKLLPSFLPSCLPSFLPAFSGFAFLDPYVLCF